MLRNEDYLQLGSNNYNDITTLGVHTHAIWKLDCSKFGFEINFKKKLHVGSSRKNLCLCIIFRVLIAFDILYSVAIEIFVFLLIFARK